MGQAAWAGAQYYPTEKRKKKVDGVAAQIILQDYLNKEKYENE